MQTSPQNSYLGNMLLMGLLLGGFAMAGMPADAWAQNGKGQSGFVIAANGQVSITSKEAVARQASLRQGVFQHDVIKAGADSSAKVLLDDNTLLSVTENSQVEITEYIYDPDTAKRSTILKMAQGKLKVLVAEFYAATGSRFEIHTPAAVAAARGTEYVVFTSLVNGQTVTTVAVTSGSVTVTSGGVSVTVPAGSFTTAAPNAPPAPPAATSSNASVQSQAAKAEVKTAPAVVGAVQIAMAQQAQAAQQAIAGGTAGTAAAPPAVPSLPGGISTTMGTTNTPCTFVSGSGNVPLGCIPQ